MTCAQIMYFLLLSYQNNMRFRGHIFHGRPRTIKITFRGITINGIYVSDVCASDIINIKTCC